MYLYDTCPVTICTFSAYSIGRRLNQVMATGIEGTGNVAWPLDSLAIFIPIRVPSPWLVKGGLVASVGTAGNIDVGIYDMAGTRIISNGGVVPTSASIFVQLTDTMIGPGNYYMAMSTDSGVNATRRYAPSASIIYGALFGVKEATSCYPLPATATLVDLTRNYIPLIGLTTRTTS